MECPECFKYDNLDKIPNFCSTCGKRFKKFNENEYINEIKKLLLETNYIVYYSKNYQISQHTFIKNDNGNHISYNELKIMLDDNSLLYQNDNNNAKIYEYIGYKHDNSLNHLKNSLNEEIKILRKKYDLIDDKDKKNEYFKQIQKLEENYEKVLQEEDSCLSYSSEFEGTIKSLNILLNKSDKIFIIEIINLRQELINGKNDDDKLILTTINEIDIKIVDKIDKNFKYFKYIRQDFRKKTISTSINI